MIKLFIIENGIGGFDTCLGQGNFLCFFQRNVGGRLAVFSISRVVIVIINGFNARRKR